MIRTGASVAAVLAALALPAATARATGTGAPAAKAPPAAVQVIAPMCEAAPLSLPAFLDSLRVELAAGATSCCAASGRGMEPGTVRVALAVEPCDAAAGRMIVTADEAAAGRSARREIALDDVAPDARPRALALAVAELVRAVHQGASTVPTATTTTTSPSSSSSSSSFGAAADAELRFYPARSTALWGGRLSLLADSLRWQAALTAGAVAGDQHTELGSVAIRALTLGASAGPRFALPYGALTVGLAAELGWARVAGAPAAPEIRAAAGSGPTAAVRAQLGIEARATRRLRLRALLAAGVTVLGLDASADGAPAGGMSGMSIVAAVGVGLAGPP